MYFYYYPCPYPVPYVYNVPYEARARQFPQVDPQMLYESATESMRLMKEASIVLGKFSESKEFGGKVMAAAQESKHDEVQKLIQSLGVKSDVKVNYTPNSLTMEFIAKVENVDCCNLVISLRWR